MIEVIVTFIVGIICIVIGIMNMKGNVSMLHSYHTKNVKEEDKKPFGKLVGLGMIIIGGSIIAYSILETLTIQLKDKTYTIIGTIIIIIGLIIGLSISFYAMKKYNKGIF
jgi:heme/copper-type cytochrome/quinol oxidase subunit 2